MSSGKHSNSPVYFYAGFILTMLNRTGELDER